MSGKSSPSPRSSPVIWAKLTRVDPPATTGEEEKFEPVDATPSAQSQKGKAYKYVIKSNEFKDGDSFAINSETFNMGRANSCHLTIRYNKLVSGTHCCIQRDEEGTVWLEDKSTNGTLVNKTRKVIKDKIKLDNGDMIHLVFKNSETAENVGFRFNLCDEEVEEATQVADDTLDEEIDTPVKPLPSGSKRSLSPSSEESSVAKKKAHVEDSEEVDEIGETLLCIICQDIFHDCVSLQPCMHSFCAGCYSEWMATSNECPCCRLKVDRINKNHLVNNLVESYLKTHPQKKRSESDIKELDSKNKITHDMLYKKLKRQNSSQSSGSESPMSSQSSDGGSPVPLPCAFPAQPPPTFINYNPAFARNVPTFGPPRTICRQCPQNANRRQDSNTSCAAACAATVAAPAVPGPSTADAAAANTPDPDAKSNPQAPNYVCVPGQNHVLCMCCLQAMPDRRTTGDPTLPKQQCAICYRFYCHAYWTCPKADCLGCLGKFREMNFGRKCLTSILLENQFESTVLRDYLDSKGISVRQLLDACITKLEAREYSTTDSNRGALNADTVVCYPCGLRNLQELAYQYRVGVDVADLPDAVTTRENCYWGRGCRTQKHKPQHAAKLNHICEATRNRP